MRVRLKNVIANIGLVTASLLFSALVIELLLRFAYPRYESAAEAQLDMDTLRIWAPRANRRSIKRHPDTAVEHLVIYNDLALRQSRNFDDLESAVNVAFFGDSYTANVGLPSPYSFTEPLDYLLNSLSSDDPRFNVLNFGVNGYGTDQAYLYYEGSELNRHLDYVFYVLCANDLRNIFENNLFKLDDKGVLAKNPVAGSPWWIRLAARLHITYLALDLRQRILYSRNADLEEYRKLLETIGMRQARSERTHGPRADQLQADFLREVQTDDLARVVGIFELLLQEWQRSVQANGGKFYVVLLPTGREELFMDFISDEIEVISLYESFRRVYPDFSYSQIKFEIDGLWNEAGNGLAAVHLFRFLERELGLQTMDESEVNRNLSTYYSAFADDPALLVKFAEIFRAEASGQDVNAALGDAPGDTLELLLPDAADNLRRTYVEFVLEPASAADVYD